MCQRLSKVTRNIICSTDLSVQLTDDGLVVVFDLPTNLQVDVETRVLLKIKRNYATIVFDADFVTFSHRLADNICGRSILNS